MFARLLRYIREGKVAECIDVLSSVVNNGRDIAQFITDFIWYLRNLLVIKTSDEEVEIFDISAEQLEMLKNEAKSCETSTLMRNITIYSELSDVIRRATQKRVLAELCLIRSCMPQTETDLLSLTERIRMVEERIESGVFVKQDQEEPEEDDSPQIAVDALPEDVKNLAKNWKEFIKDMPAPVSLLCESAVLSVEGTQLVMYYENEVDCNLMESNKDQLLSILEDRLKSRFDIKIKQKAMTKTQKKKADLTNILKIAYETID